MNDIAVVIEYLKSKQLILTTAESCTAGLVASMLTEISGCGAVLHGGYIVYSEQAKQRCLGVSASTIKKYGLTSEEVAREMAVGALQNDTSDANLAVAITGTAESDNELDGVICFAYALKNHRGHCRIFSETISFDGDRNQVRQSAAKHALLQLPNVCERLQSLQPE